MWYGRPPANFFFFHYYLLELLWYFAVHIPCLCDQQHYLAATNPCVRKSSFMHWNWKKKKMGKRPLLDTTNGSLFVFITSSGLSFFCLLLWFFFFFFRKFLFAFNSLQCIKLLPGILVRVYSVRCKVVQIMFQNVCQFTLFTIRFFVIRIYVANRA